MSDLEFDDEDFDLDSLASHSKRPNKPVSKQVHNSHNLNTKHSRKSSLDDDFDFDDLDKPAKPRSSSNNQYNNINLFSKDYNSSLQSINDAVEQYKQGKIRNPSGVPEEQKLRSINELVEEVRRSKLTETSKSAHDKQVEFDDELNEKLRQIEFESLQTKRTIKGLQEPALAVYRPVPKEEVSDSRIDELYRIFDENKRLAAENKQLDEELKSKQKDDKQQRKETVDRLHRIMEENKLLLKENQLLDDKLRSLEEKKKASDSTRLISQQQREKQQLGETFVSTRDEVVHNPPSSPTKRSDSTLPSSTAATGSMPQEQPSSPSTPSRSSWLQSWLPTVTQSSSPNYKSILPRSNVSSPVKKTLPESLKSTSLSVSNRPNSQSMRPSSMQQDTFRGFHNWPEFLIPEQKNYVKINKKEVKTLALSRYANRIR